MAGTYPNFSLTLVPAAEDRPALGTCLTTLPVLAVAPFLLVTFPILQWDFRRAAFAAFSSRPTTFGALQASVVVVTGQCRRRI